MAKQAQKQSARHNIQDAIEGGADDFDAKVKAKKEAEERKAAARMQRGGKGASAVKDGKSNDLKGLGAFGEENKEIEIDPMFKNTIELSLMDK